MLSPIMHRTLLAASITVSNLVAPLAWAAPPAAPAGSAYALPHNFYGAHLLVDSGSGRGDMHLRWARNLVGRWGHAKTLFMNIDQEAAGPAPQWVDYVNRCYELELIPFLRLAGHMRDGQWIKPEADGPGDYTSIAAAFRRVVEGMPRSDLCPLYVEIWNEPNLPVEWSGQPDPAEYAAFFVQTAAAIRDIGDERIRILNGGLATSPEWTRKLCEAHQDFIRMFDLWSSHPYPMNRPPSINLHDGTARPGSQQTIDSYLLELAELAELGRKDVWVMITETGYDLGNGVYTRSEGHPPIDEYNRADYMVRAFRDHYPKWKEVVAVFPFQFSNEGWTRFDWVDPASGIRPDGSPTKPHYQYTAVAALAKPTDRTGAISGTITVHELGSRLEGVMVTAGRQRMVTDPMGNYFLPRLPPGLYVLRAAKGGFQSVEQKLEVSAGANTVFDSGLRAMQRATLTGTVRSGDDDQPLAGASIRLEPGGLTAQTGDDGTYRVTDCIPARYTLVASAEGRYIYEDPQVEVAAGKPNRHDFRLGLRATTHGENLLNNPSMEIEGASAGRSGIATGFETAAPDYPAGRTNLRQNVAHTGHRSQAIKAQPDEVVVRQLTHYNTAVPGALYQAGAWVRVSIPDRGGGAWISLDFCANDGRVLHREAAGKIQGRSPTWVWISVQAEAPDGAERLMLNLHAQGRSGEALFDDVHLGQLPK